MRALALSLLCTFVVAGCASLQPVWVKPNTAAAEMDADLASCSQAAAAFTGALERANAKKACMENRGYTLMTAEEAKKQGVALTR